MSEEFFCFDNDNKDFFGSDDSIEYIIEKKLKKDQKINDEKFPTELNISPCETRNKIKNILSATNSEISPEVVFSLIDLVFSLPDLDDEIPVKASTLKNILCMWLSKKASRQNIPENAQFEYLKKRGINIDKPASKEQYYDRSKHKFRPEKNEHTGKSIDGIIKKDKSIHYIGLKYIKEAGGAQDNQLEDGFNILKNGIDYFTVHKESSNKFYLLVTGDYATKKLSELNDRVPANLKDKIKAQTIDQYISENSTE
jgi:hypothetical protein